MRRATQFELVQPAVGTGRPARQASERVAGKQLALEYFHLSIDHAAQVQFTTASKGKVFHGVRKRFRKHGVFKRRHEY